MEIAGLVILGILVLLGAPLWAALIIGAAISLVGGYGLDPIMLPALMFDKVHIIALLPIPLFLLCGEALHLGGAARPIVDFLTKFMGHVPGGPAYVVIVACAVVAAMSSSSMAAVAGFAPILVPMMMDMGYSRKFAIGLLVAASSLGPLIPPSIPLIIYGYVTETSVRDLYSAAFLPGALIAALLAVTVFIHTRRGHYTTPPAASWRERWQALKKAWPVLLMPPIVLVPIYTGVATPTEAAGVAAAYSLFLGLFVYRELTPRRLWEAFSRTIHVSTIIFAILMAAMLLQLVLVYMRLPMDLGEWIAGAGFNQATFLIVIIVLYLLMGAFLDPASILIILPPILLPTVLGLDISPVVFGVLVVISVEIACLTPPYGITLFAASSVLKEDFMFIAKGCFMFYPALIVGQLLVAYVPQIALFMT